MLKLSGNVIIYKKYVNKNCHTRHTKSNTFPLLHVHAFFIFVLFLQEVLIVLIASPKYRFETAIR